MFPSVVKHQVQNVSDVVEDGSSAWSHLTSEIRGGEIHETLVVDAEVRFGRIMHRAEG